MSSEVETSHCLQKKVQDGMHAIAQHRPQAHPEEPLSQQMFAGSRRCAWRVTLRNHIATQELS